MMCNLVCQALGRHVHIDYCRAEDATACLGNNEAQHVFKRLLPHADRPKDFLTHNLFWRRSGELSCCPCVAGMMKSIGFKDPYSREEQTNFAKWWVSQCLVYIINFIPSLATPCSAVKSLLLSIFVGYSSSHQVLNTLLQRAVPLSHLFVLCLSFTSQWNQTTIQRPSVTSPMMGIFSLVGTPW